MDKAMATGIANYINNNGIGNNPGDPAFEAANSMKLYKLNSNEVKMGMGITLKVMAGDKIDVFGKSYYFTNNPGSNFNNAIPVLDLLNAFLNAPAAAATTKGATAAAINTPTGIAGINTMMSNQTTQNNTAPLKPRAFINVIFFDEQFKAVSYKASMVGSNSVVKDHYSELQNIAVQKSGYVYIYCSNESPVNVFFDNVQVVHSRGPLLEENHYYMHGLLMAGVSSKSSGKPENRYRFNGIEQNNDFDLNLYDAFYRNLDPQLGRWWQIDPETNYSESPFVSMGNNPIKNIDWLGNYFTWANGTVEDTYSKLRKENNRLIGSYTDQLSKLDLNSSDEGVQGQISQLTNLINSHAELNSQWDEMESSSTEFYVSGDMPTAGAQGDAGYNADKNRIDIRLGKNSKSLETMAHEFRHGYGYLNGEMVGSRAGERLVDITDEVVAYRAGNLFTGLKYDIEKVAKGDINVDWFKKYYLNRENYKHLTGREESLTLNTPGATFMKYSPNSRISFVLGSNKNNANMNVQGAINILNQSSQKLYGKPEYYYGNLLNNK